MTNKLFESYKMLMNDSEWRYAHRMNIDWFIELDGMDPRGQCGPIYRPMNKIEFVKKCEDNYNFEKIWLNFKN